MPTPLSQHTPLCTIRSLPPLCPQTRLQQSELIYAVHELLLEHLISHEVYNFGIIAGVGDTGWYITDKITGEFIKDGSLWVTQINKITRCHNVAKDTQLTQYEFLSVPTEDGHKYTCDVCLTIHSDEIRVSFILGRDKTLDVADPQSLDDLLEFMR